MSRHNKSRTWAVLLGSLFALLLAVGTASAQTDPYVSDVGGTGGGPGGGGGSGSGGEVVGKTAKPAKPAKAGRLAVTGGDVALFVVVGVTLLASGFALVTIAKRNGAPAA